MGLAMMLVLFLSLRGTQKQELTFFQQQQQGAELLQIELDKRFPNQKPYSYFLTTVYFLYALKQRLLVVLQTGFVDQAAEAYKQCDGMLQDLYNAGQVLFAVFSTQMHNAQGVYIPLSQDGEALFVAFTQKLQQSQSFLDMYALQYLIPADVSGQVDPQLVWPPPLPIQPKQKQAGPNPRTVLAVKLGAIILGLAGAYGIAWYFGLFRDPISEELDRLEKELKTNEKLLIELKALATNQGAAYQVEIEQLTLGEVSLGESMVQVKTLKTTIDEDSRHFNEDVAKSPKAVHKQAKAIKISWDKSFEKLNGRVKESGQSCKNQIEANKEVVTPLQTLSSILTDRISKMHSELSVLDTRIKDVKQKSS